MIDYINEMIFSQFVIFCAFVYSIGKSTYYGICEYVRKKLVINRIAQEELLNELVQYEDTIELLSEDLQVAQEIIANLTDGLVIRDDDGNVVEDHDIHEAIARWSDYTREDLEEVKKVLKKSN